MTIVNVILSILSILVAIIFLIAGYLCWCAEDWVFRLIGLACFVLCAFFTFAAFKPGVSEWLMDILFWFV